MTSVQSIGPAYQDSLRISIQKPSATSTDRQICTMLQTVESPIEVGINDCMPSLAADACKWADKLSTSIVHQIVNATVTLYCVLHECLNLGDYIIGAGDYVTSVAINITGWYCCHDITV